ncbi:hypothetical protein BpHYR1_008356 [Brachionus plicatilis]|uniref:Uncharacterized protein n=1 Tax=Brachionus plicatilis TaxID=10195 RepID=A0A3M7PYV9_BRAPC|nr:hypothetical protein BpHYR1_008356 [Brachionus plicatilis]
MKILTSLAVLLFIVVVVKVEAKPSSQLIQEKLFKLRESLQKEKQTAQSAISASLINQKKFDQASPANLEMLPNVKSYLIFANDELISRYEDTHPNIISDGQNLDFDFKFYIFEVKSEL